MEETIGQFAKRVGTTVRTLRYYDSIGLLQTKKRNTKGQKVYTHEEWERYQQILVCKHLGMSLEETKNLLEDLHISPQAMLQLQKRILKQKKK
ncbi:MerR family transcriptional regulator [Bacillus sp. JCM 19041]|uniref:MerR family transcriptional regulator n=1 Tax=Bacillus sp. JCM 19041 TaxID=1460637 RepID=UPI0006D0D7FD